MNSATSWEWEIAEFASPARKASLDSALYEKAQEAFLDCTACIVAGLASPLLGPLRTATTVCGGPGRASAVSFRSGMTGPWAAFVNGALGHASDFDDDNYPMIGHPSVVLVPTILAACEIAHGTGRDALIAYVTGFEVLAKLGRALNPAHYAAGWHATATIGMLAATAAAASVLKLGRDVTLSALGLAASSVGGVRENFGTMGKPFHAGKAAREGLTCALLAKSGMTASASALTGRFGWTRLASGGESTGRRRRSLGLDSHGYELLRTAGKPPSGVAFKAYPCCSNTHTAIEAALEIAGAETIDRSRIARVRCGVNREALNILTCHEPTTGLAGKFSLEYCVAVALLDGKVGLDQFSDRRASDRVLQRLARRVEPYVDKRIAGRDGLWMTPCILEVVLDDGRSLAARVDYPRGHPRRPLTKTDLLAKLEQCAERHYAPSQVERGADLLYSMRNASTLEPLGRWLRQARA